MLPSDDRRAKTVRVQDFFTFRYLNDLFTTGGGIWTDQFKQMASSWEEMQRPDYSFSRWLPDAMSIWGNWARAVERMSTVHLTSTAASHSPPVAVFVIDRTADTTDPRELMVPAGVGRHEEVRNTSLTHNAGGPAIPANHVMVRPSAVGGNLSVKLVGIKDVSLRQGQYSGAVYVPRDGHNKMVALIHVMVDETTVKGSTGPFDRADVQPEAAAGPASQRRGGGRNGTMSKAQVKAKAKPKTE
ncbi:MAG: hypothetical protein ABJA82_02330 [Myxococcales bacterium]